MIAAIQSSTTNEEAHCLAESASPGPNGTTRPRPFAQEITLARWNSGNASKSYYGHFFCHVFHQDYLMKKGVDPVEMEHRLLEVMDGRGAEYPAEHNVGHLYSAKPGLVAHYRALGPTNQLNPGIGKTSRRGDGSDASERNGSGN